MMSPSRGPPHPRLLPGMHAGQEGRVGEGLGGGGGRGEQEVALLLAGTVSRPPHPRPPPPPPLDCLCIGLFVSWQANPHDPYAARWVGLPPFHARGTHAREARPPLRHARPCGTADHPHQSGMVAGNPSPTLRRCPPAACRPCCRHCFPPPLGRGGGQGRPLICRSLPQPRHRRLGRHCGHPASVPAPCYPESMGGGGGREGALLVSIPLLPLLLWPL